MRALEVVAAGSTNGITTRLHPVLAVRALHPMPIMMPLLGVQPYSQRTVTYGSPEVLSPKGSAVSVVAAARPRCSVTIAAECGGRWVGLQFKLGSRDVLPLTGDGTC